ncbi:extracellular solute-binding protein [Thermocrispum municipale]|jgi:multiple sugar transport system substrate-binding protein|uniref:extracellular solute-binding protein n=1 Tax=Thermocrispum municipale TaxID=37926 RepID=UPI000693771E|nr:extracellular solute-binding protein [Thermocrispum municipale]
MRFSRRASRAGRRIAALGAIAALALTAATACGSDEAEGDGKTITFVAAEYSDKTEPYWKDLISRFEKENPGLKVNLQVINWDEIDGQVQNMVLNDKAPDLLNLNKYADFAADELLFKASDVLPKEVIDDFIPSFAENSKYEGDQYGLPFIASARLLFYNKDLFDKAGVKEPPKTWDELKEAAKKISDLPGDYIGYGLPLGPEEAQGEFQIWMNSNGGHWVDDKGNWTIDSPENLETLQFLKSMVDEGLTQPNPAKTDRADVIEAFAAGKIGMIRGLPQTHNNIADQGNKFKYDVAPNPVNDGQEPTTLGVQDYLMAFDNGTGAQETLKKFLTFFYQEENYSKFITTEGFLPTTQSASDKLSDDEKLEPFIEALPKAKFYPVTDPQWTAVDSAVKQDIGQALRGTDPKKVLEQLQKTAEG